MDSEFDLPLDESFAGGLEWSVRTAELAQQASIVLLFVMLAMVLMLVFIALTPSRPSPLPDSANLPLGWEAQKLLRLSRSVATKHAQATASVGAFRPSGPQTLERSGADPPAAAEDDGEDLIFTVSDAVALAALRRRVERGEVADGPTAPQRLAFARWLAEHDRLRN
jgi:hypothetical protein